ncbi:hypothetical protein PR202_ga03930 [Eleusine coracana subsp. coracana]|uniref:Uncharacterized protein n=1 Tax=Eleusine coracana subsp. coracana TaxID=191504 RepID=A0AAV5BRQ4_ELECO|nr:hypothetical protein PR202_ga03930 [Eleusine coracana subsp. coracana]
MQVSFEDKKKELFEMVLLISSIMIFSIFSEIYAMDLNVAGAQEDLKVANYVVEKLNPDRDGGSEKLFYGIDFCYAKKCLLKQVLSPEMSLATVRTYIWKKPEDLILHYRMVQSR